MRVAVDIGGTFTDVVVFDDSNGKVDFAKTLSRPSEPARGVQEGLRKSAVPLNETDTFIHGSTVVVNAVIERKGAKTAFITTEGFRDVYEIGRINRPESFNPQFAKHVPLIPRSQIFEVEERLLGDGTEHLPLNEGQALQVAEAIKAAGFEAVGVLFMHSYRSPEHEIRMGEILREVCPDMYVSLSHELTREYREYERTSTTAANAYVGPVVDHYLHDLEARLTDDGFDGRLMIMLSNGGLSDADTARQQPIHMMESGPAGGVVGTLAICEALDIESAIAFDMGGTTAKACVVRRGVPDTSPDYYIGGYNEGLVIHIPVLDIVEVGTGGGSIAWFDEGGALHVGPRSAAAEPGPACYGLGGTDATITDANLVLGKLSATAFMGGEMHLSEEAAKGAIERLSGPLGVTVERAATGMLEIAEASMANVVRNVTLERGLDPRDFVLVAYGGGGPLHAAALARELGIGTIVIPQSPGHFSALGMLTANLRRDFVQTLFKKLSDLDGADLEGAYRELERAGRDVLIESGVPLDQILFERSADMRYVGQEHAVAVSVPGHIAGDFDKDQIKKVFDETHQLRYSHSAPNEPAQIVSVRVTAVGSLSKPGLPHVPAGEAVPPQDAHRGTRTVIMNGESETAVVFARDGLRAGNVISGPALVQEVASTTVIEPGSVATVNEYGHLVIRVGALSDLS